MTDPIADMLTRLRNANQAYHDAVTMPYSKLKQGVAEILKQEGYITSFDVKEPAEGEVGRTLAPEDFDLERIFKKDGVRILHLSGLIAAMSESTSACCLAVARAAKAAGSAVSFDMNYRASFWKGRERDAAWRN